GVQAIFREIAFQQAFIIHHGAEVVEIDAVISHAVILHPAIEFENLLRWAQREEYLRTLGVAVDGRDRGKHNADAVNARDIGHGLQVGFDFCRDVGPVLPAMSLVPARMTTTLGSRAITSARKRSSIWGVVCPLMPRLM